MNQATIQARGPADADASDEDFASLSEEAAARGCIGILLRIISFGPLMPLEGLRSPLGVGARRVRCMAAL